MKRTRDQMKADLKQSADDAIEELLDWTEQTPEPTLAQIEEVILKLRQRLSERMAETVVETQDASRPVPGPRCPRCGQEMHYKGQKPNTVETSVGSVPMERAYYYCATCRAGLFPPG